MTPDQLDALIEYIQAERAYSEHLAKHGSASVKKRDGAEDTLRRTFKDTDTLRNKIADYIVVEASYHEMIGGEPLGKGVAEILRLIASSIRDRKEWWG